MTKEIRLAQTCFVVNLFFISGIINSYNIYDRMKSNNKNTKAAKRVIFYFKISTMSLENENIIERKIKWHSPFW